MTVSAMPDVRVNGLLANQAVVTIDGQQRILKVGKTSPEGITLVSADSKQAVFSWNGERFERTISRQIASQFSAPAEKQEARIERGRNGHFFTPGHINGQMVSFLVDTGAFAVAMSKDEADRLGLDWRNGERFMSSTAGGATASHLVTLKSVTVGGVTLHNIKGAVIVAEPMEHILLGMSFLERMEMREENNTLVLRKKY
jgi:aspartyl protease family protein